MMKNVTCIMYTESLVIDKLDNQTMFYITYDFCSPYKVLFKYAR